MPGSTSAVGIAGSSDLRATDLSAQIHHGLIEIGGAFGGHDGFGELPELFLSGRGTDIVLQCEQPGVKTFGICFDDGGREIKSE